MYSVAHLDYSFPFGKFEPPKGSEIEVDEKKRYTKYSKAMRKLFEVQSGEGEERKIYEHAAIEQCSGDFTPKAFVNIFKLAKKMGVTHKTMGSDWHGLNKKYIMLGGFISDQQKKAGVESKEEFYNGLGDQKQVQEKEKKFYTDLAGEFGKSMPQVQFKSIRDLWIKEPKEQFESIRDTAKMLVKNFVFDETSTAGSTQSS